MAHYGFDVSYDADSHILNIFRKKLSTPIYTKEIWEASVSKQVCADIIDGDIQVSLDGQIASSYAIQGNLLIMFDELQRYGTVGWDQYSRQISVTIFRDELQRELDSAGEKVETEYQSVDSGYVLAEYTGQVDENNLPNGIGISELTDGLTKITYLGYFSKGKPDGLIYKETAHTVTKSYTYREIRFIGKVDGSRESKREYVTSQAGSTTTLLREPNFGVSVLPIKEIPEWTGPETLPDRMAYLEGCYFEWWSGKDGKHDYWIWHDGDTLQTIADMDFGGGMNRTVIDTLRNENQSVRSTTNFYEYINGVKSYYNGSIQTISGTGAVEDPIILNDSAVGGGQSPIIISVAVNGAELSFDVLPVIQNERVLVPVRAIFESLGANVSWNEKTQAVIAEKGEKTITLQVDNNIMQIDDKAILLDVSPKVLNGRTLVPIRAVSEAFGASVEWLEPLKQVVIIAE